MTGGRRVLIVEDNTSMREILTVFLERAGFDVVAVSEYQRAMELIRKDLFDSVVADLDLPGGTGLDLVHNARALRPRMRAFLMTGYGCSAIRKQVEALSPHGYLEKPFDPDDLVNRLKED